MSIPEPLTQSPTVPTTTSVPEEDTPPASITTLIEECERLIHPHVDPIVVEKTVDLTTGSYFTSTFYPTNSCRTYRGGVLVVMLYDGSSTRLDHILTWSGTNELVQVTFKYNSKPVSNVYKVGVVDRPHQGVLIVNLMDPGIFVEGTRWSSYTFLIKPTNELKSFTADTFVGRHKTQWKKISRSSPHPEENVATAHLKINAIYDLIKAMAVQPEGMTSCVSREAREAFVKHSNKKRKRIESEETKEDDDSSFDSSDHESL